MTQLRCSFTLSMSLRPGEVVSLTLPGFSLSSDGSAFAETASAERSAGGGGGEEGDEVGVELDVAARGSYTASYAVATSQLHLTATDAFPAAHEHVVVGELRACVCVRVRL